MNFKHLRNLQYSIDGMKKIFAISWSPNLLRLAVAHVDENHTVRISLYDENGDKKEMFQTKPASRNSRSYIVKEIAFSPDSTKLAVSQTDCIIFVYNFGHNWGDKKIICNKFEQNSAVTAMVWPNKKSHELFFGIADGKIKMGMLRSNSAQVLYATGSYVLSMSYNQANTTIISAHMDLSVYLYSLEKKTTLKITTMPSISYSIAYLINDMFLIATLDKKIYVYNSTGEISQLFDYGKMENLKDFTVIKANSSFDLVAIGNYNKLFIFGYNVKQLKWQEACILDVENYYSFTALCWKQDFGILVTGSLCGSLDMFESCLKKTLLADQFEITYISLTQIIVKDIEKNKRMTIKTSLSNEILKVNIQNNNFIIVNTETSLIVGDLTTQKWSEVPWNTNGNEKYDFNNNNTCLVYVNGEIAVIEYGNSEIVGYFRTDFPHPNLISAKISSNKNKNIKIIAFLVDPYTIYVQDLLTLTIMTNHVNDSQIEYLEFNQNGSKLIYRDANKNLNLLFVKEGKKATLLPLCGFVQWVPNTDVLVAQANKNLVVWYNIDNYQNPKTIPIKGSIEEVQKSKGKYEVYINEASDNFNFSTTNFSNNGSVNANNDSVKKIFLDENLINLSLAIEDRELSKAVLILESLPQNNETSIYWKSLGKIAIEERNLPVAMRCFASLGKYSKLSYIKRIIKEKEKNGNNPLIEAKILVLEKEFKEAEELMIKNNMIKEAIDVFKEMHKYEDSLRLAEKFHLDEYEVMKKEYLEWLVESEMFDKAAELKIKDGSLIEAIKYYIQGDLQVKAANLIIKNKIDVDKNTLDYLINTIREVGLNDKSEELRKYAESVEKNKQKS